MGVNRKFLKGDIIFREGTFQMSMYQILSGRVAFYKNYGSRGERLLTEYGAGKWFGEMGLIEVLSRSATAVCLEDTEIVECNSDNFTEFFKKDPEAILNLYNNLSERLRELSDEYSDACFTVAEVLDVEELNKKPGLFSKIAAIIAKGDQYGHYSNVEDFEERNWSIMNDDTKHW